MSVPAISIQNFTKRYGKVTAVDDLSIDVPKGSIFGLLGQNGAGKTTTIRTILDEPSPGRCLVADRVDADEHDPGELVVELVVELVAALRGADGASVAPQLVREQFGVVVADHPPPPRGDR